MAILLRDLYKETKSTYGLDLIAGEEGLDNLMNSGLYIRRSRHTGIPARR